MAAYDSLDTEELIELVKELRALGAVEITAGQYTVKFAGSFAEPRTAEPLEPQSRPSKPKTIRELAVDRWGPLNFPGND